jgi:hypothetical protein
MKIAPAVAALGEEEGNGYARSVAEAVVIAQTRPKQLDALQYSFQNPAAARMKDDGSSLGLASLQRSSF